MEIRIFIQLVFKHDLVYCENEQIRKIDDFCYDGRECNVNIWNENIESIQT